MDKINWHAMRMTEKQFQLLPITPIITVRVICSNGISSAIDEILNEQKTNCIPIIINNDIENWHKTGEETK